MAALILPTSAMWLDKVPAAEIDMVHVAFVAASILCLLRAVEERVGVGEKGRKGRGGEYFCNSPPLPFSPAPLLPFLPPIGGSRRPWRWPGVS